MKKKVILIILIYSSLSVKAQWVGTTTTSNVGIGVISPIEKLEINGNAKVGLVSIGGDISTESPKNYINLASDVHGTLLLSSNLYLSGSSLFNAQSHSTISGAAIKIPGNGRIRQNNIEFWTTPVGSVTSGGSYTQTSPRMIINPFGYIGIGTVNPKYILDVIGTIRAREIKVDLEGADFVFEKNYKLMPLDELEKFVKEQKHLPEIIPASEMEKNGTELGDLNSKLLQKIEELTLYTIDQQKQIDELKKQNEKLKNIEEKIAKLEASLK